MSTQDQESRSSGATDPGSPDPAEGGPRSKDYRDYSDKAAEYFARARTDIAPLLPAQIGRVLEFGCGTGTTLEWLKRTRNAQETLGVEIEPGVAEQARARVDRVLTLDAEREAFPAGLGRYDLILCLDVLEHLRDPWSFVARIAAEQLAPEGLIIASIPNVRHAKVLLPLLLGGRWDYADAGLLDRTHLRFFTRSTALALMSAEPLAVRALLEDPPPGTRTALLDRLTLGLLKPFLTTQYLIAAGLRSSGA